MREQPKRSIGDPDSGLVVMPNRGGMSFLANRVVADQLALFLTGNSHEGISKVD